MHDVVVIGSGPAGCATALALLREGISRICIIDSANSGGVAVGETLPPEVRIVLKELGVWDNFLADGHEPCLGSCSAWGSDRLGYNDFLLNPHGPGWHIDRRQFDTFLLSNVASQGIIIHKGQVIGCVDDDRNGFRLFVKGANKVQSAVAGRFVVDATGRRSLFARWTGAEPRLLDRLTLLYGFFDASEGYSSSKLTMIEATEMGWWYAAPLPNRRYAVAFATDPEVVRTATCSVRTVGLRHFCGPNTSRGGSRAVAFWEGLSSSGVRPPLCSIRSPERTGWRLETRPPPMTLSLRKEFKRLLRPGSRLQGP